MIRFSKIPRLAERMNVMIFLGNFNDTAQLLMPVGVGAWVGGDTARRWAALGGQPPVARLTHFPCCPQQLNAIIAASMSLKSSSKLRNILEVRGARPWPQWGGTSGRAGCTSAVPTCPMRPDCVGAWGGDIPRLVGSAPPPYLSPCISSDRAGLRELHEQQQARGCLRLPAAEPRRGRFGAGLLRGSRALRGMR